MMSTTTMMMSSPALSWAAWPTSSIVTSSEARTQNTLGVNNRAAKLASVRTSAGEDKRNKLGREDSREEGRWTFHTRLGENRPTAAEGTVTITVISISQVKACAVVGICWPQEAVFPLRYWRFLRALYSASFEICFCCQVLSSQLFKKLLFRNVLLEQHSWPCSVICGSTECPLCRHGPLFPVWSSLFCRAYAPVSIVVMVMHPSTSISLEIYRSQEIICF